MKKIKLVISFLALINLSLGTTVQAANNDVGLKEAFETLSKKNKLMDVWLEAREAFSQSERQAVDLFMLMNENLAMPKIEVLPTKQTDGSESYRVILNVNSKTISLEMKQDERFLFQLNGKNVSATDAVSISALVKIIKANEKNNSLNLSKINYGLGTKTLSSMSLEEKAKYILYVRRLVEAAQKVQMAHLPSTKTSSLKLEILKQLIGACAEAADDAAPQCLSKLGYISKMTPEKNCLEPLKPLSESVVLSNVQCFNKVDSLCNPLLYGLSQANNGSGLCLSSSEINTTTCAQKFKSDFAAKEQQNTVQRIVASLKTLKLQDGKTLAESDQLDGLLKDMLQSVNKSVAICKYAYEKDPKNRSVNCAELSDRLAAYNKFLIEKKREAVVASTPAPKPTEAQQPTKAPVEEAKGVKTNNKIEECSIWCSMTKFMKSDYGLIAGTVIGTAATIKLICATKNHILGLCNRKNSSTAASSTPPKNILPAPLFGISAEGSNPFSTDNSKTIMAPTAPQFSGGVQ